MVISHCIVQIYAVLTNSNINGFEADLLISLHVFTFLKHEK